MTVSKTALQSRASLRENEMSAHSPKAFNDMIYGCLKKLDSALAIGSRQSADLKPDLAEYVEQFRNPRSVPAWEHFNVRAKYALTTRAAEVARAKRG